MKKIQTIIAVALLAGLSFINNIASAAILTGYTKYYTPEEIVVNDIIEFVFGVLFFMFMLMLFVGIYKDCKNKKGNKNFSMIKFIFISFASCFIMFIASVSYADLFVEYIYYFYPYYFTYIGIIIFLIPIYLFAKILAKIFRLEFLIILSFFMILFSFFVINA